jgi:glycosyltransferase 2 family protein
MRLAINLVLSTAMLALFLWLVWPDKTTRGQVGAALHQLDIGTFAPYLGGYLVLMVVVHLCRALRWNNLLAPLGVRVPAGPLLAISSVGFLAILALPARLGEFVRPGLLRRRGVSASAALGTVAVERIGDGLLVSLFVFGAFFALRDDPRAPDWMMPTAYAALGVFGLAMVFLVAAMRRPAATVRVCLAISLLPRLSPRVAGVVEGKLLQMIRGFDVLKDQQNLGVFVVWSVIYWLANGLGLWVLARGFAAAGLPELSLSLVGAYATMGLIAVGITLPNSPGLVGQFQWFTLLGLSLYLGPGALDKGTPLYASAYAFASTHYVLQVAWYLAMGALGLLTPWVSLHDLWQARKTGAPDPA